MGSSAFEKSFNQMKENLGNFELQISENNYKNLFDEYIKEKEDNNIKNFILESFEEDLEPNSKIKKELIRDITNIKPKDKNHFIFLSYYEYKLIASLDKPKIRLNIDEKIEKAKTLMDKLKLNKFKSLLSYKIAEFYFSKVEEENNKLEKEKNKKSSSYSKIKYYLEQCLFFSNKNDNNQKAYSEFNDKINNIFNKIYIKELFDKDNYEDALKIALQIKDNIKDEEEERDEANSYLSTCYEKLGLKQKKYDEAKKYFQEILNDDRKNQLLFQLNEKMINECIEKNNLTESLKYFF